MAFAGLRRDPQRASVLAYLASYSPDAPEAPAPLPAEAAETVTDEVVEAGAEVLEDTPIVGEDATGIIEEATETIDANIEAAEDAIESAPEDVIDAIEN